MQRLPLAASVLLLLSGCQISTSAPAVSPQRSAAERGVRADQGTCSSASQHLRNKRRTAYIPAIPSDGNFGGYMQYGPLIGKHFRASSFEVDSCTFNNYSVPVPTGYTPDWFGAMEICTGRGYCHPLSFGSASVNAEISSTTWVNGTTYYLYIYTIRGRQLLEYYSIGSVQIEKNHLPFLKFASPLENGFVYPSGDVLGFEIVHPS